MLSNDIDFVRRTEIAFAPELGVETEDDRFVFRQGSGPEDGGVMERLSIQVKAGGYGSAMLEVD